MDSRIVLYGHAAYFTDDGECSIPADTTFTVYAPSGALLDKPVADALASGEIINSNDIQPIRDMIFFFNHSLDTPKTSANQEELLTYPKVYVTGDSVPHFFLKPAQPQISNEPLYPTPTQVVTVEKKTSLKELLEQHKGSHIHWAACSFAKSPDLNAVGYGYGYKLIPQSRLHALYTPKKLSEAEIRQKRAERFGITNQNPATSTTTRSTTRKSSYQRSQNTLFSSDQSSHIKGLRGQPYTKSSVSRDTPRTSLSRRDK